MSWRKTMIKTKTLLALSIRPDQTGLNNTARDVRVLCFVANGQRQRSQQRGPKAGPDQSWIKAQKPTPHMKVRYSHIPTKPTLPR